MGVTNNFYLLSKSPVKTNDIEKIEINLEELSKQFHQRIIEKSSDNINSWELEEVKELFKIEFKENNWFIGDEDFFFYKDETNEIEIREFAENELKYHAICPNCTSNLYNKILKIVIEKFESQEHNTLINFPFFENQKGVQCPRCNLIIDLNKLTGRKIIGKFRIDLPHLIFEYFSWEEIVGYFNSHEKNDFYIEHYQYP